MLVTLHLHVKRQDSTYINSEPRNEKSLVRGIAAGPRAEVLKSSEGIPKKETLERTKLAT